ncbi:MAG: NTP transferase domain-containing protein [bacterium]|nr:NTP transferase domain-containing protein [bacterium]
MKTVIIAAGAGTRLGALTAGTPKGLIPLLGFPLIKRVICAVREAGVEEFVIVTGFAEEKLKANLGTGKDLGVKLEYVSNPDWRKGNGISVLAASGRAGLAEAIDPSERFLLMMSDHVFEPELIKRILEGKVADDECLLGCDLNWQGVYDLSDATRVLIDKGKIKDIGKEIPSFNAVDCGVFLCSGAIFKALKETIAKGNDSLSDGVRSLARDGKMKAGEITGLFWQDVDTKKDIKYAEKQMLKRLTKPQDGIVSRKMNRPVSAIFTKYLVKIGMTPNQATVITFLIALLAAYLVSKGRFITGGLLVQLSSIFDGVDGELARLKYSSSYLGAWLDKVFDRVGTSFITLGAAWGYYQITQDIQIWILCFLVFLTNILYWTSNETLTIMGIISRDHPVWENLFNRWFLKHELSLVFCHDVFMLVLAIGIISGLLKPVFWLIIIWRTLYWVTKSFVYQDRMLRK